VKKKGEILGGAGTFGGGGGARSVAKYYSGNLKGGHHLEDLGSDGRIILK